MTPNLQPTLHGRLLTLRPLLATDRDAVFAAAADPLIWEQHPERDRYKPEVFVKFFESAMASMGAFAAIDNATGAVAGSSRYYMREPEEGCIGIGYTFLVRRCWANGYNKDMKRLMIDHAFTFADTVIFHIGVHNYRSQKAVEKTGATLYRSSPTEVEYRLCQRDWQMNALYGREAWQAGG